MGKLSEIFRSYGDIYLAKYSHSMLPSHKKALFDISSCRTHVMGGHVYKCNSCKSYHYSFHSCGNRSCNNCQNNNADEWLNKNKNLLLPVDYFMITFTIPEELRLFARSNQKLFYNLLFNCSARTIDAFSSNPKHIGGKPAYLGILHTWSRKLSFHPHIHYIVTAGGLSVKDKKWVSSHNKFLFPVEALSIVFKAKFRDELRKLNPQIFNQIAPRVWTKKWVVNSIPVGNGCHAMKYLAQYVFRVAISNNRIIKNQGGFVTFKYKDSKTKVYKLMKMTTEEFIRRFLQHVLPKGFVKVRYFGLFASKNRNLLSIVRQLFDSTTIINTKSNDKTAATNKSSVILCPFCGSQMILFLTILPAKYYNKSPPLDNHSFIINEINS